MRMIGLVFAVASAFLLAACPFEDSDLQKSGAAQKAVMANAQNSVPAHRPTAFPAREDINWYLRETERRGTWFIYALAMTGQPVFYIVSDMKPRNICISISSPDRIHGDSWGNVRMSAPALDGVYYGGAGCDSYYMRDAATGGYIELSGRTFTLVTSRAPLFLETDVQRLEPAPVEEKAE